MASKRCSTSPTGRRILALCMVGSGLVERCAAAGFVDGEEGGHDEGGQGGD